MVKIVPKNFILGNLKKVNNNLDKKITVFKGQFVRTFVMNLEKNTFDKLQENIKYHQITTKNNEQECLYDENDDKPNYKERISSSYSPFKTKYNYYQNMGKNLLNSSTKFREKSSELSKSITHSQYEGQKCMKQIDLPKVILMNKKNNLSESKDFELKDISKLMRSPGIHQKQMKNKSKSVKKLNPKSFFEHKDFYYL